MTQQIQDFDVLALELKLDDDFNKSNGSYYDGEYDAKLGFEPSKDNWMNQKIYWKKST